MTTASAAKTTSGTAMEKATSAYRKAVHTENTLKDVSKLLADTVLDHQRHVIGCEEGQKKLLAAVSRIEAAVAQNKNTMDDGFSRLGDRVASLETFRVAEQTAYQRAKTLAEGREMARAEMRATVRGWLKKAGIPFVVISLLVGFLANFTQIGANVRSMTDTVIVKQTTTRTGP